MVRFQVALELEIVPPLSNFSGSFYFLNAFSTGGYCICFAKMHYRNPLPEKDRRLLTNQ